MKFYRGFSGISLFKKEFGIEKNLQSHLHCRNLAVYFNSCIAEK